MMKEAEKDWEARFEVSQSDNWRWLLVAAVLSVPICFTLGFFFFPLAAMAIQAGLTIAIVVVLIRLASKRPRPKHFAIQFTLLLTIACVFAGWIGLSLLLLLAGKI